LEHSPVISIATLTALAWVSLGCATLPALLFCWNAVLYRPPPDPGSDGDAVALPPVSLLIPARDEEQSIAAAVESVLASSGIELEVVVLDDASTDRTAEVVSAIAARDPRLRLEKAPPLPPGWNGKQHACAVLASLARHDVLCFLDADVRLAPDAVRRMAAFLRSSRSELVSGFPRQETVTPMEWLLLPLIHFVLLGFLPLSMMRRSASPAFAAGCGQFLMVDRRAYEACGTHAAIRATMHDGIKLPALLRAHGNRTDLADLTALASCRMYHSASQVWRGMAKNATEGMAAPSRIVIFTVLLLCGQVLPFVLLVVAVTGHRRRAAWVVALALCASLLPRALGVWRFSQPMRGAALHPLGVFVLLVLQWYALIQKLRGKQAHWKQRAYDPG
jgi:Glycosyltransferase like family 2